MEDPTPAENQDGFRLIRQHTVTPIAVGEIFNTICDCQHADRRAADRLHPHDGRARRRHHAPARASRTSPSCYQVRTGSTAPPTCRRCAWARRCISTRGCTTSASRSTCGTRAETDAVFPHAYCFEDGYLHPGDAPGHGVDIDEALAAKLSVPTERAAGEPPGGRLDVELVSRSRRPRSSRPVRTSGRRKQPAPMSAVPAPSNVPTWKPPIQYAPDSRTTTAAAHRASLRHRRRARATAGFRSSVAPSRRVGLEVPGLAARLLEQAHALDAHRAIDRLAHVVDRRAGRPPRRSAPPSRRRCGPRVSAVTSIVDRAAPPRRSRTRRATRVSGSGCASGISSAVRLAAWIAAMRATPSTSPLFADPARIASSVAGCIAMRPPARAIRLRDILAGDVDHVRLTRRHQNG